LTPRPVPRLLPATSTQTGFFHLGTLRLQLDLYMQQSLLEDQPVAPDEPPAPPVP
jgi:hypothetical protein